MAFPWNCAAESGWWYGLYKEQSAGSSSSRGITCFYHPANSHTGSQPGHKRSVYTVRQVRNIVILCPRGDVDLGSLALRGIECSRSALSSTSATPSSCNRLHYDDPVVVQGVTPLDNYYSVFIVHLTNLFICRLVYTVYTITDRLKFWKIEFLNIGLVFCNTFI